VLFSTFGSKNSQRLSATQVDSSDASESLNVISMQEPSLKDTGPRSFTDVASGQPGNIDVPATIESVNNVDVLFQDWQNELPDSEILAQYMDLFEEFPDNDQYGSHTQFAQPVGSSSVHSQIPQKDNSSYFISPLPWVSDWTLLYPTDDDSRATLLQQKVFNLPSQAEISILIRLFFTYVQQRLPVLLERDFYILLTQESFQDGQSAPPPISLAMLYAIMFAACPVSIVSGKVGAGPQADSVKYLSTESSLSHLESSIRAKRCEFYSRAAVMMLSFLHIFGELPNGHSYFSNLVVKWML
jgi:hypothetical protein